MNAVPVRLAMGGSAALGAPSANVTPRSRVGLGAAPARQIFRLFASRQAQRPLHRGGKIFFDRLPFYLSAEENPPQKIPERGGGLGQTAPPGRRSPPARLRNGSSFNCMTVFGMSIKPRRRPCASKG